MRRQTFAPKNMTPEMRGLLERVGVLPPETPFNRRAAAYAEKAVAMATADMARKARAAAKKALPEE